MREIYRVLLVEENIDNSNNIKSILECKGYVVRAVRNELDAVTMASNEKFDLILMDHQMPLMDGIRATKLIREIDENVSIISISLRNDKEYIDKCRECGMNGHYPKSAFVVVLKSSPFNRVFEFLNGESCVVED